MGRMTTSLWRWLLWIPLLLSLWCSAKFFETTPASAPASAPTTAPVERSEQAPAWTQLEPGLRHATLLIADTAKEAEVFVASLDRVRFVAVDARSAQRKVARVARLREESGATVLVNGTFFDAAQSPLGLLVHDGKQLNPLRTADWGVLEQVGDGQARLVHTRDYVASPQRAFAVQCGPRVVIEGRPPKLRPQQARRTAVCLRDPNEAVLLVVEERIDATALADWMAAPAPEGLACDDALLLDGGPSTQLSAKHGDFDLDVMGGWGVPNAIGFSVFAHREPPADR